VFFLCFRCRIILESCFRLAILSNKKARLRIALVTYRMYNVIMDMCIHMHNFTHEKEWTMFLKNY